MNDETNIKYYKKRYMIVFYRLLDNGDEQFVASFDNLVELCQYKELPTTDRNLALIKNDLYRVLKKCPPTTTMLNGTEMRVYLIDMFRDDDLEDKLEQQRRDKCMANKKFVQITSSMNIEVYASLQAIQVVNAGSVGNKLNAKSGWTKIRVLVTSGTSWYPSEILNWPAVKALTAKEIFTIGVQSDTINNPEVLKKCEAELAAITKAKRDVDREKERVKNTAKANAENAAKEAE